MKLKLYITMALLLGVISFSKAQSGLEIQKVFDQYGKNKGVTMVELKNGEFGGLEFSLFRSITITNNPVATDFLRKCIEKDQQGAKKVKQVLVNGVPQSVFLELPKSGKLNRMILFNQITKTENKVILIYIESETDSENILKFILKKK